MKTYESFSFLLRWPKMSKRESLTLLASVAAKSSFSGKSFMSWLYLWTIVVLLNQRMLELILELNRLSLMVFPATFLCALLQSCVCNETDSGVEPLSVLEDIQSEN